MMLQKFRQPTVLVTENRNEMSPHQKREEKSLSHVRKLTTNGHLKCTLTSLSFTAEVVQGVQANLLPGPSRRLAPVLKCGPFLSFFQRYIVRDISLTEIYRWLIEILSTILKSTRHGGQSRERL